MKTRYFSDNGPTCYSCGSTCYMYSVDDQVTYIYAKCASCNADFSFYPKTFDGLDNGAAVSASHKEATL